MASLSFNLATSSQRCRSYTLIVVLRASSQYSLTPDKRQYTVGFVNEWYVRLQGRRCDLQELPKLFSSPDVTVSEQDGVYVLKSRKFSELEDPYEVFDIAAHILELVHGVAKLTLGDFEAVKADAVWRFDEEGHKHAAMVFAETIPITVRVGGTATATVLRANGTIDSEQSSPVSTSRLTAALQHDGIARALIYMREPSWWNLYKIYEVIGEEVGGKEEIWKAGWATKQELSDFRQTAQSREALGDAARHAAKKFKAPENPMSLSRARSLIMGLLRNWIDSYIK